MQKCSMENTEGVWKLCLVQIVKSHCIFYKLVYSGGPWYQANVKLELKRSRFISLLETLKKDGQMDRQIKIGNWNNGIMKHIHTLSTYIYI